MSTAKLGDRVSVHYVGTLDDGEVFDSSEGRAPLAFTLGAGQVIPGFENAVLGMSAGETRSVRIPADEAYGPYQDDLVHRVGRVELPPELDLELGQVLRVRAPDGGPLSLTVVELDDEFVVLDGNHPMAGEDLNFQISLVVIG